MTDNNARNVNAEDIGAEDISIDNYVEETDSTAPVSDAMGEYIAGLRYYPMLHNKEEIQLKEKVEAGEAGAIILKSKGKGRKVTKTDVNRAIKEKGTYYTELWKTHKDDLQKNLVGLNDEELQNVIDEGGAAKNKMVTGALRYVIKISKPYFKRTASMSQMDIVQEGNIGLIAGIDHYDYKTGNALLTCATMWIKQRIERSIETNDKTIRQPVYATRLSKQILSFKAEYYAKHNCYPSDDEIKNHFDITDETFSVINANMRDIISLNTTISPDDDGESELMNFIPDSTGSPESAFISNAFSEEVLRLLNTGDFNERERMIFCMRYGLNESQSSYTLEEIGQVFGVTRERIRQIEVTVIRKLRNKLVKQQFRSGNNEGGLTAGEMYKATAAAWM